jgi:WD40 repeat protein
VLRLHRETDPRGLGEELLRSQLAQTVPALGRLLRAASFVLDYPLVIVRSGACESWMGHRRVRRRLAAITGPTPLERQPVLVDREGRSSLVLWPLAQVSPPTPGVDDELFLFDGPDRRGARMVAAPLGFELHDPGLWDWLGEHALTRSDEHAAATAEARAPFLGLEAFSAADADRFFGREREVDALANRLRTTALQIVVGPSGAGKSSFVHAGLVPALPPGSRVVTMRPGHRPVATLAARLGAAGIAAAEASGTQEESPQSAAARITDAAGDGLIVIVVDQLEELFTLCRDEAAREWFCTLVDRLTSAADGRVRVICTMRDDFLMRAAALPVLGPRVAPCIFLLGNPSREDLIRTVVEPARQAGYELSDAELAPEMADAVAGRPGALALLSFTASQLWELRDRRFHQLTRRAYEAMGGVGGALGQHAERTIAALGAEERRLVREAFRHLVTAEGTRAQLSITELGQVLASPSANAVIDKLVAARLLVIAEHEDGARVEIIHEALLAAWPRVQEWLREDADSASMRDQVRSAARQWDERGRPRGLLWHDDSLADLERWRRRREDHGLTASERAFADASRHAATRVRRVRRIALVSAFAVLGIALAVMFWLRGEAAHQRGLVQEQLVQSYVDRGQQALLGSNVELALESLETAFRMGARTPTVRFLLARARESKAAELVTLRGHDGRLDDVAFSPDRTRVLTVGHDGTIRIWDPTSGRVLQILRHHVPMAVAAWNPNGQGIVTADTAGTVRLWTNDGRLRASLTSARGAIMQITYRNDGALFALARMAGDVVIRDARSGELRAAWMADPKHLYSVAFDPSGTRVVTAGESGVAVVWSLEGQQQAKLEGHADAIWSAVFDHRGERIITVSRDATAYVWDAHTGKALHRLQGHDGRVTNVAIDDRDRLIATTGTDGTARIWSLDTGKLLATLRGHTAQVNKAIFAPDDQLVTLAADGTARIWDLTLGAQIAMYHHGGFLARGADLDPQARRLATASWSGTAKIWDLRRQSRIRTFSHPVAQITRGFESPRAMLAAGRLARIGPRGVAVWELSTSDFWMREVPEATDGTLTSDGQSVIAADTRGMLHVLDASGQLRHRFHAHAQKIASVAAYPDGRRVATCGVDGTIAVWELPSGRKLAQRRVGAVTAIRLSPDGSAMFAFEKGREWEGKATGWLLAGDLSRVISLEHDAGLLDVAFSPDKAQLATLTHDGIARIWNLDGKLEATLHHSGMLMSAAWSADGSWLATGTSGGVLTIWDPSSWQPRKKIEAHSNFISALAFDENGTLLASAGGDGLAKIWDTERFFQVGAVPADGLVQHLVFTRGQLLVSGSRATQSWRCDHYQGANPEWPSD